MCGRYYRRSDKQRIADAFRLGRLPEGFVLPPDYNVAPATHQPVIRANRDSGEREVEMMRWGLVPYFAKSPAEYKAFSTINAKAENVMNNPTWRTPFRRRRCIVPADGFYEWKTLSPKMKQPYAFTLSGGQPLAFAAMWDAWKDSAGQWLITYAIITTDANELMAPVHNRMPVILEPKDYDRWLSRDEAEPPPIDLLRPFAAEKMSAQPVDPRVGNVKNNEPNLCEPLSCPPNSA